QDIHKIHPDIILSAGDLLIGKVDAKTNVPVHLLKELSRWYPIYCGNGNHESRLAHHPEVYGKTYEEYEKALLSFGVSILRNESKTMEIKGNRIRLTGLELPEKYYEKFNHYTLEKSWLDQNLGQSKKGILQILLAHHPAYFHTYAQWGADISVSGHLHGGILRLPLIGGVITPQAKLFPKYDRGHYQIQDKHLIVSPGLGGHTIDIRLNNPPLLMVINMTNTSQ
ncbi:MAG TPA: metallophosphoesterase, partial [Candidatus Merdenecus merdavium]|nr:metallophosphoesterase [Candidatus Merdenecus merdavium]